MASELNEIVYLNVGGVYYDTTLSTLTKYPETMLANMFSGKFKLVKDRKNRIFIDRSGKLFEYILHYLRTNCIDFKIDGLIRECQYFGFEFGLKFVGYAIVDQNSTRSNGDLIEERSQELIMKAAKKVHSDCRPLSYKEYVDKVQIYGLHENNTSGLHIVFFGPDSIVIDRRNYLHSLPPLEKFDGVCTGMVYNGLCTIICVID